MVNQDQPLRIGFLFTIPTPVLAGSLSSTLGICLEIWTALESPMNSQPKNKGFWFWGSGSLDFFLGGTFQIQPIWCLSGWWLRVWCLRNIENLHKREGSGAACNFNCWYFWYQPLKSTHFNFVQKQPKIKPNFCPVFCKQGCFALVVYKHVSIHFKWKHSFHEPWDGSLLQVYLILKFYQTSTCQDGEGFFQQDHMRYNVDTQDSSSSMVTESCWLATLSTNNCSPAHERFVVRLVEIALRSSLWCIEFSGGDVAGCPFWRHSLMDDVFFAHTWCMGSKTWDMKRNVSNVCNVC